MILVITTSEDQTADFLCRSLQKDGLATLRFDTDIDAPSLRSRYVVGEPELRIREHSISPADVDHIWYRRPKPLVISGEFRGKAEHLHTQAEMTEAIEGFLSHVPEKKWMNHPARNAVASHKLEQLTRAAQKGLYVPDTLMTQDPEEAKAFFTKHRGQVIVKPLASGYLERDDGCDSLVYTNAIANEDLQHLVRVLSSPTLFQVRVQKCTDVRICVVDAEMTAVAMFKEEAGQQILDIRRDNMAGVKYEPISVPPDVRAQLHALMKSYSLRFGAIDMAVSDSGRWTFFEINPNGQWAWLDIVGGANIAAQFSRAFHSRAKTQR